MLKCAQMARCPRAGRQPTPAPRPARVDVGCPPPRKGPETVVRLHRGLPRTPYTFAGGQKAVAVLLVRAARPGLDAGALRHYSTNACKGGGKSAENPWKEGHSHLHAGAATIRRAPVRGWRGERKGEHGQSAAAPVLTTVPLGGRIGAGKAPQLFERVAAPRGGQHVAWHPRGSRGRSSGDAVSATARTGPRTAAQPGIPRASVDDGGMGPRPAWPNDPTTSAPCRLVR